MVAAWLVFSCLHSALLRCSCLLFGEYGGEEGQVCGKAGAGSTGDVFQQEAEALPLDGDNHRWILGPVPLQVWYQMT